MLKTNAVKSSIPSIKGYKIFYYPKVKYPITSLLHIASPVAKLFGWYNWFWSVLMNIIELYIYQNLLIKAYLYNTIISIFYDIKIIFLLEKKNGD